MDRRWLEEVKKISNEELLREAERKGSKEVIAGEEILSRISEKKIIEEKRYLEAIVRNVRISGTPDVQRKARIVNEEAIKLLTERGYLNERNISMVLWKAESQKILEKVIRKYLAENENISNHLLRTMIRSIKSLSLKEELARKLQDQARTTDDFMVIEEESEDLERFPKGSPLQIEAEEKLWKREMEPENFTWLTGFGSPSQAERNWERGKREDMIEKLSRDDLSEILHYSDSQKIKEETMEILLNRRGLTIDHLRPVVEALKSIKVDEETLKKIMDRLESLRTITERKISEKGGGGEQFETLDSIGELKQKVKEVLKNLKEENGLAKASFLAEAGNKIPSSFFYPIRSLPKD